MRKLTRLIKSYNRQGICTLTPPQANPNHWAKKYPSRKEKGRLFRLKVSRTKQWLGQHGAEFDYLEWTTAPQWFWVCKAWRRRWKAYHAKDIPHAVQYARSRHRN